MRYAAVGVLLFAFAILVTLPGFAQDQATPKDTIILSKGKNPLGGVKFDHKKHSTMADVKCETCHHASKAEMPAKAPQQACSDCHTNPVKAPMKTKYQGAFHNPTAKAGLCVDCHKESNTKGKKAPTTCVTCHKKENVAG